MSVGKDLSTEKRTIVTEVDPIEFNRRVYRNKASERLFVPPVPMTPI